MKWKHITPMGVYTFPMPEAYSHNRECFYAAYTLGYGARNGEGAWFVPGGFYMHNLAAYSRLMVGMDQLAFGYVIGEDWVVVP